MQIAQIVPKTRTQKETIFDYAIPLELLPMVRQGILVEIPFHGRKIEGIIIKFKPKSQISNLKSILGIIDPIPVIDEIHIQLARWMSDYYLSPLGKTLFENIVPPAKRTIKQFERLSNLNARTVKINKHEIKKYLIIGDFSKRLTFYLKAIDKTLLRNKTTIILVPDLTLIHFFKKYIRNPLSILHAGLTKTQRWLEWDRIRRGQIKIVIGSNSALFAPMQNLGLIIIDQEENETYKNDRSPRFNSVNVAEHLSRLTGANIVLGTLTPRVETYYSAVQTKYRLIKKEPMPKSISIVDMNSEKYIISNTLEATIETTLKDKKKVLLVLNRKGEGTKFTCTDCGWIAYCENCGLPLIPQRAENVCFHCEKSFEYPTSCPECNSVLLKPTGIGTAKLKKFLTDLFLDAKIIQIEKEKDSSNIGNHWDIAITTSYGLKFKWPEIETVGIIDADQGFNFPDFSSPQKNFETLYKFLKIGERGIIQTKLPENPTICALAQMDYEKFFLEEITQRKKYNFPPFVQLIRLLYKNADEQICQKETQKVYQNLLNLTGNDKPDSLASRRSGPAGRQLTTISPPHPAFFTKQRRKFRYQIIIRTKRELDNKTKNILQSLSKGWIIDVDPINLL